MPGYEFLQPLEAIVDCRFVECCLNDIIKRAESLDMLTGRHGEQDLLTDIDKASGRALAELLALVGERHLDNAGYVSRRGLDPYRVRCDQLAPHQHCAKDHLQSVKEVVAHNDDCGAACGPALAGRYRLDAGRGHGQRRVEACKWCGNKRD